ncbi:hypothetical protein [Streptomyces europaeiscabiei]|uniref:hypothetical protein n=1 Tax=Streptomyces europaeiscabiei TaxID=146819 RepID=UPI0038F6A4F6
MQTRLHQRGPTAPWRDLDGIASPTARALAADIARAAHLLSPADPPHALDAILRSRLTVLSQGNNQPQSATGGLTEAEARSLCVQMAEPFLRGAQEQCSTAR